MKPSVAMLDRGLGPTPDDLDLEIAIEHVVNQGCVFGRGSGKFAVPLHVVAELIHLFLG